MKAELLSSLCDLVDGSIRPQAADADRGRIDGVVKENIRTLAGKGFLGLAVEPAFGGLGEDETGQHEYTEVLASACGVTAFTQHQLRTGVKYVSESTNDDLKRRILSSLAVGRSYCGVGVSQLRRPGKPMLVAKPADGGYIVDGVIPWITAWSLLSGFVMGAAIDNDRDYLLAYVDIEGNQSYLKAGEDLPLVVMQASGTVSVEVSNLFVPEQDVVAIRPKDEFHLCDVRMITTHTAMPLGCARGAERYLRELAQKLERQDLEQTAIAVMFEIDHCRREALTWNCECVEHPDYKKFALRARATAIVLGMRAAHAAVAASGGASQLITSAPQRLLREAQFYTTAVQTPEVQSNVLDQLFSPYFGM